MTSISLRCEYRENPLGIDVPNPRLSWTIKDQTNARLCTQIAYQILVASDLKQLAGDTGDLWDSGRTESNQNSLVRYEGKSLGSGQQVWWKVRVWTDRANLDWSEPATFTMGLLGPRDWQGKWIGANLPVMSSTLPTLRRVIAIKSPITRAVVFCCGLGQIELHVNGRAVSGDVLDPGWTNYKKTCLYVTHDITPFLRPGENVIGVMLGNGMYNIASSKRYKKFKASFGNPKMLLQMQIEFTDGSREIIASDESWRTAPGPITFSCIYGGEDHDARQDQPGWDSPGFDDSHWSNAIVVDSPGGKLVSQSAPPIRVMRTFPGRRIESTDASAPIYDFGQNFSGFPKITCQGNPGDSVKLIPGELLDSAGQVSQKSSGSPVYFQYTLGKGEQTWQPRFAYTGFRYVQAQGAVDSIKSLDGQFIHSSAAVVGNFKCSNPLLNRIHDLINAAILSNMQSVLTDCPHREKLGWLEQSHLMGEAIMFNYDVPLLYAKICADMRDAQQPDGCVPTIAPEYVVFKDQWADFSNSPEWGSAAVINPWLIYQQYGDRHILEDNYEMMRGYVEYLHSREEDGIINFGLGDWYDIGPGDPGYSKLTSKGLTGTAIYYRDLVILQRTSKLLGKRDDSQRYAAFLGRIPQAFNGKFYDSRTGQYDRGSQTANAMPLALGLVEPSQRDRVLENLIRDICQHDNHITAGDIGFRFVIDALGNADRSDVIYDLLCRTDAPSYGSQLSQGATTLTEAWDANPTKSQNHLMLGHAELWFYQYLAGIRLDNSQESPGRIVIKPAIIAGLDWAEASYLSTFGKIASRWERAGEKLKMTVEIPFNTMATVHMPANNAITFSPSDGVRFVKTDKNKAIFEIGPGAYVVESKVQ